MSRELIAAMYEQHVFDAMLLNADLGRFHVPFDELRGEHATEAALQDSVARFERVALNGISGSGKSSVVRHVMDPAPDGIAPIWLSLAYKDDSLATDPLSFAQSIVDALSAHAVAAQRLTDAQREEVLAAATGEIPLPTVARRRGGSLGVKAWMLQGSVARDVSTTVSGGEMRRSEGEVLERANDVLEAIRAHGRQPVVVMDDTDRLIGRGDPDRLIPSFFGGVLRAAIEDLRAGVVIAVQPYYLKRDDYREHARGIIEAHVAIPEVPDVGGVAAILTARVHYTEPTASASEVFTAAALEELFEVYRRQPSRTVRALLLAAHHALNRAREADAEQIGVDHVQAGADDALLH